MDSPRLFGHGRFSDAEHGATEHRARTLRHDGCGGHDGPQPLELEARLLFGRGCQREDRAQIVCPNCRGSARYRGMHAATGCRAVVSAKGKAPDVGAPGASTFTLNRDQQSKGMEPMNDSQLLSAPTDEIRNDPRGLFWRGHEATPRQQRLASPKKGRITQADVLIAMLRRTREKGGALELPEIMAVGIAQHGARFKEIRERGFVVVNQLERAEDGRILSRYFLRHDPERDAQ